MFFERFVFFLQNFVLSYQLTILLWVLYSFLFSSFLSNPFFSKQNFLFFQRAGWTSQSPTNDVTIETQHLLKGLTLDHYLAEGHFVSSNSTSKRIRSSLFQLKKKQSISFSIEQINAVEQGLCTYGEISAKSQICETMFFKLIITQPAANCR